MNVDYFNSMNISASALTAQRMRIDVISSNIANAESTRSADGGPYRRRSVVFGEILNDAISAGRSENDSLTANFGGVQIDKISEDNSPFKRVYDPSHSDADAEGYVLMPNVNVLREMVDLINAQRAYEANVTAMSTTKSFAEAALRIGRG